MFVQTLEIFHYSIRWRRLAIYDMTGFTTLTWHKEQPSGIFRPIRLTSPEDIAKQLDDLDLYSQAGKHDGSAAVHTLSLFSYDIHRIIAPFIKPIVNMVTTLEIHPTARPPYSTNVSL